MPSIEDIVRNGVRKTESFRNQLQVTAVAQFLDTLPAQDCPDQSEVENAGTKVFGTLLERLLSSQCLEMLSNGRPLSDGQCASIRLGFRRVVPQIQFPEPARLLEIRGLSLALAAALGTVLGAALGLTLQMPFARLVFGLREPLHVLLFAVPACLISCPIGAFAAVLFVFELSKRPFVQRFLQATLGLAAITDLWWAFRGPGAWRRLWGTLRGNMASSGKLATVQRVATCCVLILLLELGTRKATYQRDSYKKLIDLTVHRWLGIAIALLAALSNDDDRLEPQSLPDVDRLVGRIGGRIIAVYHAMPGTRDAAVQELVEAARNEGLEIPDPPVCDEETPVDTFAWAEELDEKYERFGHIRDGDQVYAERPPVIVGGRVLERGIVRKARRKA